MKIKFIRVNGRLSRKPNLLAIADGKLRVRWDKRGWMCDCPAWQNGGDEDTCPHIEAVAVLLDPRVTGEELDEVG